MFSNNVSNELKEKLLLSYLAFFAFMIPFLNISSTLKQQGKHVALLELIFILSFMFMVGYKKLLKLYVHSFNIYSFLVLCFIGICILSSLQLVDNTVYEGAGSTRPSLYRLFFIFIHILFFFTLSSFASLSSRRFEAIFIALSVGVFVVCLIFAYMYFSDFSLRRRYWFRTPPVGGHIRFISFISTCSVIVTYTLLLFGGRYTYYAKAFLLLLCSSSAGLLIFSGGRAGLLTVFIFFSVISGLYFKSSGFGIKKAVLIFVSVGVIVTLLVSVVDSPLGGAERFTDTVSSVFSGDGIAFNEDRVEVSKKISRGRMKLWEKSYNSILENPFVGLGPNGHFRVEGTRTIGPHNFVLLFAVEWGVIGCVLLLVLLLKTFLIALNNIKSNNHEVDGFVALVLFSSMTFYALFDPSYFKAQPTVVILMALAIASSKRQAVNG